MKTALLVPAAALVLAASAALLTPGDAPAPRPPLDLAPSDSLTPFGSEAELAAFLRSRARVPRRVAEEAVYQMSAPMADAAPSAAPEADGAESVTNTQHAGVDEGGIVKVHGDFLVILRRGRLFTVAVGDDQLRPVSAVDAYGPDMDPGGAWYDELLISGDQVVVIGFSYARGGTEVGLFDIDERGHLEYRSTYHLRSNDYYSSRNYASRLIGSRLIMYTPLYLWPREDDVFAGFPAIRRWHAGARDAEFRRLVTPARVYRPGRALHENDQLALHTVTVCELASGTMDCQADAVLGPPGRVFYVSPQAVYVWVSDWGRRRTPGRAPSTLYRLPLTGGRPTALGVEGAPVDQFSFLEDDGHLNVLVRSGAVGEGMWGSEIASGGAALLRVGLDRFGGGAEDAPRESYRALPTPGGYTFQNRFVGDHLLYGTGSGWGPPQQSRGSILYALRYAGGGVAPVELEHGVDRIEVMGSDAVVVGSDGSDLHFTGIDLDRHPRVAQHYVRANASQGELRSHGFFYKRDGDDSGTIGLPIRGGARPGYEHLIHGSASILFLRNGGERFLELGALEAEPERPLDDACRASCVDWYGNARPLFLRGRTFALLGYEIVEGVLDDGRIRESRRINYTPSRAVSAR